jgi:hypothetical protein
MSSTDSSTDDHAYFQAIEETFIRLRGAPLLLSPADWQLARSWHRQGIPLAVVLETLEEIFASRRERGAKGRVQGLRYCAPALEKAWAKQRELQGPGERQEIQSIDAEERLQELAGRLRDTKVLPRELAERVVGLGGSLEEIEAGLAGIDREMLEAGKRDLDLEVEQEIRDSVAASLESLRDRLDEAEAERVEARLFRESVRRRLGLPTLSLFSSTTDRN